MLQTICSGQLCRLRSSLTQSKLFPSNCGESHCVSKTQTYKSIKRVSLDMKIWCNPASTVQLATPIQHHNRCLGPPPVGLHWGHMRTANNKGLCRTSSSGPRRPTKAVSTMPSNGSVASANTAGPAKAQMAGSCVLLGRSPHRASRRRYHERCGLPPGPRGYSSGS